MDAIDQQLIQLVKERIDVVAKVGEFKKSNGENGAFIRPG
ncbi:MAG: chorismate mutase, partial [Rhodospirillales bacterium]